MKSIFLKKTSPLLKYLFALPLIILLAQVSTTPSTKVIFLIALFVAVGAAMIVPQRLLLLPVLFITYFHHSMPFFYNTTNCIILFLLTTLFIRAVGEKHSIISLRIILKNPFFLPSLCIWTSYFISWLIARFSGANNMREHSEFFFGITCSLLLANTLIGYIQKKKNIQELQLFSLGILLLNLFFGMLFLFKPGLVLIPGIIEDRSVFANESLRLSGLTFFWESYAEYLMMAAVVLVGLYTNQVFKNNRPLHYLIILVLSLTFFELLLTNTRASLVLALAGSIAVLFFATQRPVLYKIQLFATLVFLGGGSLLVVQQTGQLNFIDRMQTFQDLTLTEYGYIPTDRAEAWVPVMHYVVKEGHITGGHPAFGPFFDEGRFTRWPHNLLLLVVATIGIFGLAAYTFLLVRAFALWKRFNQIPEIHHQILFKLLWISLVLFLIESFKYDGFLRVTNNYFYHIWIIIAILFSSMNSSIQQKKNHA